MNKPITKRLNKGAGEIDVLARYVKGVPTIYAYDTLIKANRRADLAAKKFPNFVFITTEEDPGHPYYIMVQSIKDRPEIFAHALKTAKMLRIPGRKIDLWLKHDGCTADGREIYTVEGHKEMMPFTTFSLLRMIEIGYEIEITE